MDTTPVATLVRPVVGMLYCGDAPSISVAVELSYTSRDPYAITVTVHLHGRAMPWVFARILLGSGLLTPTGDGDVHIWPDHDVDGHEVVTVELCSRQGHALIELAAADARDFITGTYTIVAPGHEHRHLDIDAALAAIHAAETS